MFSPIVHFSWFKPIRIGDAGAYSADMAIDNKLGDDLQTVLDHTRLNPCSGFCHCTGFGGGSEHCLCLFSPKKHCGVSSLTWSWAPDFLFSPIVPFSWFKPIRIGDAGAYFADMAIDYKLGDDLQTVLDHTGLNPCSGFWPLYWFRWRF